MTRTVAPLLLVVLAACGGGSSEPVCTPCGDCERAVPIDTAAHLPEPITYPDPPPAGGPHASCWAPWGVSDVELPDDRWVHNLEHGAVVVLHHCPDGCATEVAALESFASGRPFVIVSPYSALPTRFAVVSWGHRLLSDCLDLDSLEAFYAAHVDDAPESTTAAPPPACN